MLIVTLVSTLAAGMVWQQWRAFEVESAERARVQSSWLLAGALDWARLILREDARDGGADGLTEPWATGLEEIRLSTFLAADKDNNTDTGLDAFLSGGIQDAQARYNLRNLLEPNAEQAKVELAILSRLCNTLGLPGGLAQQLADSLRASAAAENQLAESGSSGGSGGNNNQAGASPLLPQRVEQLVWLGLDNATLARLTPYIVMLPQRTPVNINTAPAEVLMAVIDGLDRASAQRLIQHRATLKKGFDQLTAAKALLPDKITLPPRHLSVTSNHFEVSGQLRYEDSVLREISLVQRNGMDVRVLRRDRLPLDANTHPSANPAKAASVYPNPNGLQGLDGGAAT
jgi:general secretion pathway protein K